MLRIAVMNRSLKTVLTAVLVVCACQAALAKHAHITGTARNRLADGVLNNLLSSPLGRKMPHLKYRVILLEDRNANAFSNYQGDVYITSGIFSALYADRGVWAAVIGHELGHMILHHSNFLPGFEAQLRQDYQAARSAGYDKGPPQWPDVHLGQDISALKLSREEELQADFIGMMLMAEAGYQPGFAELLDQRLRNGLGDTPGIIAAFSHHPRLETREAHVEKFYGLAMDIFQMRWPDAAKSPGGKLPPYGQIGHWTFSNEGGRLLFNVPFEVHNAAGMKVRVAAFFLDKDNRVRSREPRYRATDGSWVLNAFVPGAENKAGTVALSAPASSLAPHDPHLTAVVFLMAGGRPICVLSQHTQLDVK